MRSSAVCFLFLLKTAFADQRSFVAFAGAGPSQRRARTTLLSALFAGKGFGKGGSSERTYGVAAESPIKDVIDKEGAMEAFFSSRQEWFPIFKQIAGDLIPPDTASLLDEINDVVTEIEFHEKSSPWRQLDAIPEDEDSRQVLSKFLDSMHQALLDIPVSSDEDVDDEDDLHFLEEGRRMLAISRFHVLQNNQGGSVESVDSLFAHCWSELYSLSRADNEHTGSIILLPQYELSDLRRFADMNVVRPLEWLGVHADFEVVSLKRDSPAIRLLYKLSDMPEGDYNEEEGFAAGSE